MNHRLLTAGVVFIARTRFRILPGSEDDLRSVWDLHKNNETGKAEKMYPLLSIKISCYHVMNMLHAYP